MSRSKSPDAFRTISETAAELDLPQHVLRHWEETFGAIRPMRRAGGRRYYGPQDLAMIAGVRALLHGERYTTKGVQKIFKERGASFVLGLGQRIRAGEAPEQVLAQSLGTAPAQGPDLRPFLQRLEAARDEVRALRALV